MLLADLNQDGFGGNVLFLRLDRVPRLCPDRADAAGAVDLEAAVEAVLRRGGHWYSNPLATARSLVPKWAAVT